MSIPSLAPLLRADSAAAAPRAVGVRSEPTRPAEMAWWSWALGLGALDSPAGPGVALCLL